MGRRHSFRTRLALIVFLAAAAAGVAEARWTEAREAMADYEAANEAAETALAQQRFDEVRDKRAEARAHLRAAVAEYRAAGAPARHDDPAFLEYIDALAALGDHDLAAEALAGAVAAAPEDPRWRRMRGEQLAAAGPGLREAAFEALHRALETPDRDGEHARAQGALGRLYLDLDLYEFARDPLEAALVAAPGDIGARIGLIALDARDGAVVAAYENLRALGADAMPRDDEIRRVLRRALADFDAHRRVLPDRADAHAAYARLLYQAARPSDAVLAAFRAVALDPADHGSWTFIGRVQIQLGNLDGARGAFERSLEQNPDQPDVRALLERIDAS